MDLRRRVICAAGLMKGIEPPGISYCIIQFILYQFKNITAGLLVSGDMPFKFRFYQSAVGCIPRSGKRTACKCVMKKQPYLETGNRGYSVKGSTSLQSSCFEFIKYCCVSGVLVFIQSP